MEASRLTIECRFLGDLNDVIRAACGARDKSWTSPQFEYIQSYLQRGTARAKTMVVEKPYVDRHYLEEYGAYYFSAFRNVGPTTTRIHSFDTEFDRNKLSEWVQAAASGDAEKRDKIQGDLDDAYIGFMTVRPIPSAPIGWTILRPYKDKPTRSYIPSPTCSPGAAGAPPGRWERRWERVRSHPGGELTPCRTLASRRETMRTVNAVHSHLEASRAVFRAAQVGVEVGAGARNRP